MRKQGIVLTTMLLIMTILFCACEKAPNHNCEYGESIEENTQQLEEYTKAINSRVEAIEQSLAIIQEELTKEEDVETPVDIIVEEPPVPMTAFEIWIDEERTNPKRHKYEAIIDGLANSDDEVARGWMDDGTKKLLKLIKGNSASDIDLVEDPYAVYESLDKKIGSSSYCIRDFFCVDEYGYSVNSGVFNFLETIDQLETEKFGGRDLVFMNNDGSISGWDFDDTEVADALGISEELIDIFMYAAADVGFQVNFD